MREADVEKFIWENIIKLFGLPHTIVADNGQQFVGNKIREFYREQGITLQLSAPHYAQSNGQAESTNKTILNTIKRKLEAKKGKWASKLSNVLWSYRTTPRSSTGESPFSLCYGLEAILPTELTAPTIRSEVVQQSTHPEALVAAVDMLEDKRDKAHMALARYQQQQKRKFNRGIMVRKFSPGDLVLRQMFPNNQNPAEGKLGASWEGPYIVDVAHNTGAYHLKTVDGLKIKNPWNGSHLKKFYQ